MTHITHILHLYNMGLQSEIKLFVVNTKYILDPMPGNPNQWLISNMMCLVLLYIHWLGS